MTRILLLLVALAVPMPAAAGDDDDHDRARRAVQAGELLPLRVILDKAEAAFGGQFLKAELEREDGRMVYEIKLLTAQGRVVELYYDARTGDLVKAKK